MAVASEQQSEQQGAEQRQFPRLVLGEDQSRDLQFLYAPLDGGSPELLPEFVAIDLCAGGLGFSSPRRLDKNATVKVQFPDSSGEEPLSLEGELTWIWSFATPVEGQPWYRYGVSFAPGTDAAAERLITALRQGSPQSVTLEVTSMEEARSQAAKHLDVDADELTLTVVRREKQGGWLGRGTELLTVRADWAPPEPAVDAPLSVRVERGRVLIAVGRPQGTGQRVDIARINALLSEWPVDTRDDRMIEAAVHQMNGKPLELGRIRPTVPPDDGTPLAVKVSADEQEAWLIPWDAPPGQPIEFSVLGDVLRSGKVVAGINAKALAETAAAAPTVPVRIAVGVPPKPGQDARLEYRFEGAPSMGGPKVREDGRADFRELGFTPPVQNGAKLVEKIPVVPGVPGRTVRGTTIPVPEGIDVDPAPLVGPGTAADGDGMGLTATSDGMATQSGEKLAVLPLLTIESDVDFRTGHVEFDGSLVIQGSVRPGFRVEATGSIQVLGLLDGGSVTAGGDVQIGGIVGRDTAVVQSSGSLDTAFIEHADIHAGGAVKVGNEIRHSKVQADTVVEVAGAGRVVGGTLHAGELIQVRRISCPLGSETDIRVGWDDPSKALAPILHTEPSLLVGDEADADVLIAIGDAKRRLDRASPGGVFRKRDDRVVYTAK